MRSPRCGCEGRTPVENAFWAFAALSDAQKAEMVALWNENEAKRAHPSKLNFAPSERGE